MGVSTPPPCAGGSGAVPGRCCCLGVQPAYGADGAMNADAARHAAREGSAAVFGCDPWGWTFLSNTPKGQLLSLRCGSHVAYVTHRRVHWRLLQACQTFPAFAPVPSRAAHGTHWTVHHLALITLRCCALVHRLLRGAVACMCQCCYKMRRRPPRASWRRRNPSERRAASPDTCLVGGGREGCVGRTATQTRRFQRPVNNPCTSGCARLSRNTSHRGLERVVPTSIAAERLAVCPLQQARLELYLPLAVPRARHMSSTARARRVACARRALGLLAEISDLERSACRGEAARFSARNFTFSHALVTQTPLPLRATPCTGPSSPCYAT